MELDELSLVPSLAAAPGLPDMAIPTKEVFAFFPRTFFSRSWCVMSDDSGESDAPRHPSWFVGRRNQVELGSGWAVSSV